MEASKGGARQVELSTDELQAALQILSSEEEQQQAERRKFIRAFAFWACGGVFLFACPLGLLTVWFDKGMGWGFLIAAIVALIPFMVGFATPLGRESMRGLGNFDAVRDARGDAYGGAPGKYGLVASLLSLVMVAYGAGCVWLVYGLVTSREPNPYAVALMVLSIVILSAGMGIVYALIGTYYDRVSELRSTVDGHLKSAGAEGVTKLAAEDIDVLSQAAMKQAEHKMSRAESDLPQGQKQRWALVVAQEAEEALERLPMATRVALSRTLFALPLDPYPVDARSAPGQPDICTIDRENCAITFVRDEEQKQLTVIALVQHGSGQEVDDGA